MNTSLPSDPQFLRQYHKHCKCLKLAGMQPKTIDAYSRAIRRIGNYFDCRIDGLTSDQLLDYFTELLECHSWSTVKLDLYGLKFRRPDLGRFQRDTLFSFQASQGIDKNITKSTCYGVIYDNSCHHPRAMRDQ